MLRAVEFSDAASCCQGFQGSRPAFAGFAESFPCCCSVTSFGFARQSWSLAGWAGLLKLTGCGFVKRLVRCGLSHRMPAECVATSSR